MQKKKLIKIVELAKTNENDEYILMIRCNTLEEYCLVGDTFWKFVLDNQEIIDFKDTQAFKALKKRKVKNMETITNRQRSVARLHKAGRGEPLTVALWTMWKEGEVFEITRILPLDNGETVFEYSVK